MCIDLLQIESCSIALYIRVVYNVHTLCIVCICVMYVYYICMCIYTFVYYIYVCVQCTVCYMQMGSLIIVLRSCLFNISVLNAYFNLNPYVCMFNRQLCVVANFVYEKTCSSDFVHVLCKYCML